MNINIETILIAMSIPSAITGFCFWLLERNISKRDSQDKAERQERQRIIDEREAAREKHTLYLVKSVDAAITLVEATAKAVQRIPDAKCNGDMHEALEHAQAVKMEQKEFINEQVLKNLY